MGLFHPLNLLMLGASVVAGLVSAWWLFPIGLLLWLLMVLSVANHPEVRFRWRVGNRAPLARRFQRYFDRISRAQLTVFNSTNAASPSMRRVVQPVRAEVDRLTEQAHSLCVRMTQLENYRLVSQSKLDMQTDQRQIDQALHRADDPLVEREYAESQRALQSRVSDLASVVKQLDRVEAQLMVLANEMDSIVAEVIRLLALPPAGAVEYADRLVERLRLQSTELKTFEREAVGL
jgi:hypothetical protein